MTTTLFEDFVNAELPLRIGTVEVTPPTAGMLPVYKGVGLLTEAKSLEDAGFATVATSGSYNDLSNKPTLGTAAAQNTSAFATASQGTKADSARQAVNPAITAGTCGSASAVPVVFMAFRELCSNTGVHQEWRYASSIDGNSAN